MELLQKHYNTVVERSHQTISTRLKKKSSLDRGWHMIKPCSGQSFILEKEEFLIVEDYEGEQVADLYCFAQENHSEFLSSGKSIDYNYTLNFTTLNKLYSNKSNVMLSIEHDEVGTHDFLFAPCNTDTFRLLYDNPNPPTGCYEHLKIALQPYGIKEESINTTFNVFMNVGRSKAGILK